jgi:hypothetical protein
VKQLFWRAVALVTIAIPIVLSVVPSVSPIWHKENGPPPHTTPSVIFFASVALGILLLRLQRRKISFFITLVHELGHSLTAALVGSIPIKITMKRDGSGLAFHQYSTYPQNWKWRTVAVSAAGYAAPGVAAISAATAIRANNAYLWVVFTALLMLAMLFGLARSMTVIIVVILLLAMIGAALWWAPWSAPGVAALLATIWAVGGISGAKNQLYWIGRRECDAVHIHQQTRIPARVVGWVQIFLAIILAIAAALIAIPSEMSF